MIIRKILFICNAAETILGKQIVDGFHQKVLGCPVLLYSEQLNCFAASGTTCAAINCRPCLPLLLTVVLGAAVSCTAAGGRGLYSPG